MNTIRIDVRNCQSLENLLNQYSVWVDHQNFYYNETRPKIEISSYGWPCAAHDDIEAVNACDSDVVVIDCVTEGIHSKNYFDQYRSDHRYLIISNGSWNRDHYHFDFEYEIMHYPFFLFEMANTFLTPYKFCFYSDKTYDFAYPKNNVWISTIGNVRPVRTQLVEQLKNELSYSNYILRYSGQNMGQSCNDDMIDFGLGKFDPYTPLIEKYYHTVSQSLPLRIYNQGYFNLVVETDIELQEEFFLTEKTIKCLITGMPFVVLSTPRFLDHLHALGFKTYDSVWDETYDQINNHVHRMSAIVNLCKKLQQFDWQSNRYKLMTIAMHNRARFFHLNEISTQMFSQLALAVMSLDH